MAQTAFLPPKVELKPGMAIAINIAVPNPTPHNPMTSPSHHILSHFQDPFGIAHVHAALLESARITAVSLFWLAALPAAATLSVAAVLCDRLRSLRSTAYRLPYLRNYLAIQPLLLKRKGFESRSLGAADRSKTVRR